MTFSARANHQRLIKELRVHTKPNTAKGLRVVLIDLAMFVGALAGVLWLPSIPLKIAASLWAGFKIGGLIAVGHEAAHNAFVQGKKLNWWIGVLTFTPSLFNYRLWVYDHHHLHHADTNQADINSFEPLSLEQYRALNAWGRFKVRFFRSGNPLAFGLYYLTQRWWVVNFKPGSFLPERFHKSARFHFVWLLCYVAIALAFFGVAAPRIAPVSSGVALALGFFLPFFVAHTLFSMVLYIQHTHPGIPWVRANDGDSAAGHGEIDAEHLSFHLRLPAFLAAMIHNSLEHPVHHLLPGIPCYELREAQDKLNRLMGKDAFVEELSFKRLMATFRICKLYDYDKKQWLDFDGVPTAPAWTPFESRLHNAEPSMNPNAGALD